MTRPFTSSLPPRLCAPAPSWERTVDVVVVGSGVAGIMTALSAARGSSVLLLTKSTLDAGSTSWAQGGIAAVIDLADTTQAHFEDTMTAGAGLCSDHAVRVLVEEGPQQLARLIGYGAKLDQNASGSLSLTREGGHRVARIVHAGGDATGAEVQRALIQSLQDSHVETMEGAFVVDLLRSTGSARCVGLIASVVDELGNESVGIVHARAVVLACGGVGQMYAATTNPSVATGDGMAAALRAGAALADVEFVQFHPTVFFAGTSARGQQLLISEAVRGEGAVLLDAVGRRVMEGVHPQADLAPRDVVAKAISIRMAEGAGGIFDHVYLDATRIGADKLLARFPNIVAQCREYGIDPVREPIPVAPGEHFACGGVWTDRNGHTSLPGLYAVGETACTGVHGANRLASNSLLEGLVFGERVGAQLMLNLPGHEDPSAADIDSTDGATLWGMTRSSIALTMSRHAGVRRTADGLREATEALALHRPGVHLEAGRDGWEATNVATVSAALLGAASQRTETRGCHWREDHPDASDSWKVRIVTTMNADGTLSQRHAGLEETP
jgi:nicotinate-nucleotide pyrophosphorylase (carboxylating)